jgi:hypothetical protein
VQVVEGEETMNARAMVREIRRDMAGFRVECRGTNVYFATISWAVVMPQDAARATLARGGFHLPAHDCYGVGERRIDDFRERLDGFLATATDEATVFGCEFFNRETGQRLLSFATRHGGLYIAKRLLALFSDDLGTSKMRCPASLERLVIETPAYTAVIADSYYPEWHSQPAVVSPRPAFLDALDHWMCKIGKRIRAGLRSKPLAEHKEE